MKRSGVLLLLCSFFLSGLGILMLASIADVQGASLFHDKNHFLLNQIMYLAVAVLGCGAAAFLSPGFWFRKPVLITLGVFIVVALSLGLLISTLVDSQMAALLASGVGLMMPTLVFSGLIFPLESMPAALRWIADLIPARWYISAMRKIMIQGVDASCFAVELCVLLAMAAVLVAVAWKKFKIRLG